MHCAEGYKYFLRFWNYRRSNLSCVSCFALESRGSLDNYFTLKLPFLDQPNPHHYSLSRMIRRLPLRYVTLDTDPPPFVIYFSFLKLKKKKQKKTQRYGPTHYTSTHVFKQLNQIVRFKWKIIKLELESLFSMNYLIRKWSKWFYEYKMIDCRNTMTTDTG